MCTEAEALADIYDDVIVDSEDFLRDVNHEMRRDSAIYAVNRKKRKVGEKCVCPGPLCNRTFVKRSYQHAFHSTKCKDQFWNRVRFWRDEAKVEALLERIDEAAHGSRDDGMLTD